MPGKSVDLANLPERYLRPSDNFDARMTTCKCCSHRFNIGRDRCPACGTVYVDRTPKPLTKKARKAKERAERVPKLSATACGFCTRRGAKTNCSHCGALLHRTCVRSHMMRAHP